MGARPVDRAVQRIPLDPTTHIVTAHVEKVKLLMRSCVMTVYRDGCRGSNDERG